MSLVVLALILQPIYPLKSKKVDIECTNYHERALSYKSSGRSKLRSYAWAGSVYFNILVRASAWLSLLCAAIFFSFSIMQRNLDQALIALSLGFIFLLLKTWGYYSSQKIRCTLCQGTLLFSQPCSKHRDAKRFLILSHSQTAIFNSVLRRKCQCMYCGSWYKLGK